MHPREKLQISLRRRIAVQFLWQEGIQTVRLIGVVFHKPLHIILVFLFGDGTGAVNQRPSRLHILRGIVKDPFLQDNQILLFARRYLIFNVSLFSDDAQSGSGHIRQHDIRFSHRLSVKNGSVPA